MTVHVKRIHGMAMAARAATNHWVAMDGPPAIGGEDAGTRPMEMVLMALGGCTAMDVVSILEKKRAQIDDFEIVIEADRADEHPRVFKRIHVLYVLSGRGIRPQDVEQAIQLSEETYCSVSAMLRHTAEITTAYEIRETA